MGDGHEPTGDEQDDFVPPPDICSYCGAEFEAPDLDTILCPDCAGLMIVWKGGDHADA
jgi:hypothetical protein